jgi:hypothetical protein
LLLICGLCSGVLVSETLILGAAPAWLSVNGVGSSVTGDRETYFEFASEKELSTMLLISLIGNEESGSFIKFCCASKL